MKISEHFDVSTSEKLNKYINDTVMEVIRKKFDMLDLKYCINDPSIYLRLEDTNHRLIDQVQDFIRKNFRLNNLEQELKRELLIPEDVFKERILQRKTRFFYIIESFIQSECEKYEKIIKKERGIK